ncbi:hypothetical protein ALC56_05863 [Trachymyrmex septentrionalis]|uniref:Uncharacterized protein n=1 Tax=Trachymyrmex septentrionalis TaxID=34720 RepID=A0A151JXU8_9HYME|nr:hypothetical protein ALC56_05863 [Trachymyrmex septentrionalis]
MFYYFAALAEQSISTRSKTQKINVSQDVAKSAQKIRQPQRKRKSNVENNLETAAKQSIKKKVPKPDLEVTLKKSTKKKPTRRKLNLNKEADISVLQEDQNMDLSESIRILRDKHCNNIATVELVKTNLFQYNDSTHRDSEKMLNRKLQRNISVTNEKISPVIVTPKSTPPKLNLTPHRSKKTPKKSPISIGSPKTHSIAVPKLLKSPRKLSLAATGEDSEESLEKSDSDSHSKKSQKSKKKTLDNSSKSDRNASTAKNNRKKSNLNLILHKFSKSPKIVLKSPKSKKSKSHKLKLLSPSRMEKSPEKTPSISPNTTPNLENDKSSKISLKKSPLSKGKNLSSIKNLSPKLTKILTASQIKDMLAEPVVILDKLSPEHVKQKHVAACKTSDTSIKIRSPSNGTRNLKVIIIPVEDHVSAGTSTNRNSNSELRSNSMGIPRITTNTNRTSRIKYNALIQGKAPLVSSTPRKENMISRNNSLSDTSIGSINNTSLNTRSRHRNQSNILANTMDKNTDIENVSSPSLFDDKEISNTLEISQFPLVNVTKLNITYDKDNSMEKKQENNTYELEQPQTLNLRQMIRKRSSADANLSILKDNVKKAKVRFADISSNANSSRNSINKLNGSRSSISHNTNAQHKNNVMNSTQKSKKAETAKFTRNSLISPFKSSNLKIHRGTSVVQLNAIQATPKTFASIEKKSEKKSSLKKVPNFGRIHEQMFAKSESLVDAKKRLEARHLAFTANQSFSKDRKSEQKKPLPSDTKDGIHNRYGFKLKKSEATHLILRKQTVFSRQKQQHETRMILKGVRTNRRFELQMKSRNINL